VKKNIFFWSKDNVFNIIGQFKIFFFTIILGGMKQMLIVRGLT